MRRATSEAGEQRPPNAAQAGSYAASGCALRSQGKAGTRTA